MLDKANFFSELNDLFDPLNSKNMFDKNLNRRPMCENNPNALKIIKKLIDTFKNAEEQSFKPSNKIKKDIPPCFKGFIWTLNEILDLYESQNLEMSFND